MGNKKKAKSQSSKGSKKSSRSGGGKQNGGNGSNTKDGDGVSYGGGPNSLQAQIEWLIAPPSSQDKKNSNSQSAPPKKPQRGYHKDVCEACDEGDCLMYCDKCPVAYHAICDDPPLPPEDFETIGINWKCKRCRYMETIKTESVSEGDEESQKVDEAVAPNGSDLSGRSVVSQFFAKCLPQLAMQNPVQFSLSKDMPTYTYPFPGTSRHMLKKTRQRTNVVDVENGMVPRPTTFCYHCQRSCRVGPLIQCDKCDVFFHLDCLDPPLTTIPTTVWLCPLHVEPYLESTQLTSVALSERVKIWDDNSKPVNRGAVILNFMRKASRRNPMFRRKRPIAMKTHYDVPDMVKNLYQENVSYMQERFGSLQTLAAACEMERSKQLIGEETNKYRSKLMEEVMPVAKLLIEERAKFESLRLKNEMKMVHLQTALETYDEIQHELEPMSYEAYSEWWKGIKPKLQGSVASDVSENESELCSHVKPNEIHESAAISMDEQTNSSGSTPTTSKQNSPPKSFDTLPSTSKLTNQGSPGQVDTVQKMRNFVNDEKLRKLIEKEKVSSNNDMKAVEDILSRLNNLKETWKPQELWNDKRVNKVFEFNANDSSQRMSTTPSPQFSPPPSVRSSTPPSVQYSTTPSSVQYSTPPSSLRFSTPSSSASPSKSPLKEAKPIHMELIKTLPKKTVQKLAASHLMNLRRKRELRDPERFGYEPIHIHKTRCPSAVTSGPRPLIRFFIENTAKHVELTRRNFWVGSGNSCDWKLTDFVKCNRIHEKHAKIFYNPHENCWEILNYSANGLYVNNTLFGFKAIEVDADSSCGPERLNELQEMMDKRVDDFILKNGSKLVGLDPETCYCKPFPTMAMSSVFEGSAKLYPGHRIQIGCAKLIVQAFEFVSKDE